MQFSRIITGSVRRTAVAAAVASLALVGGSAVPASAAVDVAKGATIDTYQDWTGGAVGQFGNPNSATYGQVITVPAGKKQVKWFTFYMGGFESTGLVFRGEVYGWDGTKATNAVWESKPVHFDSSVDYQAVKFKAKKAKVKAGQQYVLFASVSKDFEQSVPGAVTNWAATGTDVYDGGVFVYQNNGGDESTWTSQSWQQIGNIDAAMMAQLK